MVTNLQFNFARSGDDLLLTYGSGQQMTVLDHYAGTGNGVERLQFANGTSYAGYLLTTATPFLIDADLTGDTTRDVIISTGDAETLTGDAAQDLLFGNGGNDVLNGGADNDLLVGGLDDDTYGFGGMDGNDTIFDTGGAADEIVFTDAGNETLAALNFSRPAGANLAITLNSSTITVFDQFAAGSSIERVTFADGATVYGYELSSSAYLIDAGLGGSGNADIIASNASNQTLIGQGGNDLLFGNGGADIITGGLGEDLLVGGDAFDTYNFAAGDGNDTIFETTAGGSPPVTGDAIVFTQSGSEVLSAFNLERVGNNLVVTYDTQTVTAFNNYGGNPVELMVFAGGATYFGYTLGATNYAINLGTTGLGGNTPDLIVSTAAGQTLSGLSANDVIFGHGGDDTLIGGTENDLLLGGADNDTYGFASDGDGNDMINETGASGTDRISIVTANAATSIAGLNVERIDADADTVLDDLRFSYNGERIDVINHFDGAAVEETVFTNGGTFLGYSLGTTAYAISTDATDPLGGAGAQNMIASASNAETLTGGTGNDLLFGNGQNDTLLGGAGNDLMIGGAGNDTFTGGAGADVMDGGGVADDDQFVYAAAGNSQLSAMDVIAAPTAATGFSAGGTADEINLVAFNFTGSIASIRETAAAAFTVADVLDFFDDAGTDRAVVVEYAGGNAQVYVDANQDGNFAAVDDLVIRLNTIAVNAMTTDNFLFV